MNRRQVLKLTLAVTGVMATNAGVGAIDKVDPDPKGVQLCTDFLTACQISDPAKRLAAVLPLVHKSMKTNDGKDLDHNTKGFSYKKACGAAKLYQVPAQVTEVHKGNTTTIGFKNTAETGRTDKYFVAKVGETNGRPAPLHVFWPQDGSAPTLVNFGSL